jgi:hypothetical protein
VKRREEVVSATNIRDFTEVAKWGGIEVHKRFDEHEAINEAEAESIAVDRLERDAEGVAAVFVPDFFADQAPVPRYRMGEGDSWRCDIER